MKAGSHDFLREKHLAIAVAMMKGTKMKKSAVLSVLILGLFGALAAVPASAGTLYSNGAANDEFLGWTINFGYSVSDSFTLSANSTVTGATFDAWLYPGDTLSTVDWSIGTAEFGGASATADTTGVFKETNEYGYDIYSESISIPDLPLAADTTYWFTLQDASVPSGNPVFWDMNNGPSVAWENTLGNLNGVEEPGSNSETFQILGNAGPVVPEPSSFLLLGSGLAGLAGLLKRKFRA